MGLLQGDERSHLITLLQRLPNIGEIGVRRVLTAGLPTGLQQVISFSNIAIADLINIVDTADGEAWMQLADGSWTVIQIVQNAIALVPGSKLQLELQALQDV